MKLLNKTLLISLLSGFAFACSDGGTGVTPLGTSIGGQLPDGDAEIFRSPESEGGSSHMGAGKHGQSGEEDRGGAPSGVPGPVPEPGTLLIVGSGLAILGTARGRRLRQQRQEQARGR